MSVLVAIVSLMMTNFNASVLSAPLAQAAELAPQTIWMNSLSNCESMGSTTIKVLDTNDYYSYGKYQFQIKTWLRYSDMFGTTPENIYSGELQDTVAQYILDNGGVSNWWICGHRVSSKLGPYPVASY
jgi:hypothetical protein